MDCGATVNRQQRKTESSVNPFLTMQIIIIIITIIIIMMIIILMMMMITIIIMVFKGAIRNFLQSLHCAANRLQHVRSSGPGAVVCKCRVTYHVVRRDSSANKSDRVEIAIYLNFLLLAEPWTDEGGEETGVPEENSWRRASENATYQSPNDSSPKRHSNPNNSIGGRLGKQTC